jgi:hypothetical protein
VRSPYLAALRTYRRPLFWVFVPLFAMSIVSLVITSSALRLTRDLLAPPDLPAEARAKLQELQTHELLAQAGQARSLMVLTLAPGCGLLFIWLGVAMSIHLKEMLGNPTSRLTPGLARAHLAVAGVVALVVTVAFPFAAALAVGSVDSSLAHASLVIVACAVSIFAVAALLAHWRPWATVAIWVGFGLLVGLGATTARVDLLWMPSAVQAAAMLAISILCVMAVGARLACFNEEMSEYHQRFPTRVGDVFGTSPGLAGWANPLYLWFSPAKDLRFSRSRGANLPESVIERARHWHAANRSARLLVLIAPFIGGLMGVMARLNGWSLQQLVGSPNMSYFAVFPVIALFGPQYRRFLTLESLRPHSRREFANAVGLALATMVAASWLLMLMTACLVTMFFHQEFPSARDLLRSILFSGSCLPILFGVAAWPHRTMLVYYAYMSLFGVMASFALIPLRLDEFPGPRLELISLGILAIGLMITRASYVRWLNEDLDSLPVATWMRQ